MPTANRMLHRPPTRAFELKEKIEEDIATARLAPGSKLDEAELAKRFNVSRTPVREALIQLASTGMIELRPRRGAVVPEMTAGRLVEMFEVMAELEAICGRLAARRMLHVEYDHLNRALAACNAVREDADDYSHKNEVFHHVIYAGSHNHFLAQQALALHRRLGSYRRLQMRVRDRIATSLAEHTSIVEAIISGEEEKASELLREHVLIGAERFADLMASLGRPVFPEIALSKRSQRRP